MCKISCLQKKCAAHLFSVWKHQADWLYRIHCYWIRCVRLCIQRRVHATTSYKHEPHWILQNAQSMVYTFLCCLYSQENESPRQCVNVCVQLCMHCVFYVTGSKLNWISIQTFHEIEYFIWQHKAPCWNFYPTNTTNSNKGTFCVEISSVMEDW